MAMKRAIMVLVNIEVSPALVCCRHRCGVVRTLFASMLAVNQPEVLGPSGIGMSDGNPLSPAASAGHPALLAPRTAPVAPLSPCRPAASQAVKVALPTWKRFCSSCWYGSPASVPSCWPGGYADENRAHPCSCCSRSFSRFPARACPGDANLGFGRRRRRQSVQPHRAVQDLRRRDLQDRRQRRDQLPRSRRLRRGDHHQVDHHRLRGHAGLDPGRGTTGINIKSRRNGDPSGSVRLRGLSINGAVRTGIRGIKFLAGAKLSVDEMFIQSFTNEGILMNSAGGDLVVRDSSITGQQCGSGIRTLSTARRGGIIHVSITGNDLHKSAGYPL